MHSSTRPPLSGRGRLAYMALLLACLGLIAAVQVASAATSITIYKNPLNSASTRSDVGQFDRKGRCTKGGSDSAFRIKVGKKTRECSYRVPVAGKSIYVTATGRLFESTPKQIRKRTFLGLSLRHSSSGSRYQLVVFPSTTRAQIRKVGSGGKVTVLAGEKLGRKRVKSLGRANQLSFGAYNGTKGKPASNARLFARVNGKRVLMVDDPKGNELSGTGSTFSIGSDQNARNAAGSFSRLVVRMPDPFG